MIPDTILDRLGAAPEDMQQEEGIQISIECIEKLKQAEGVKGVHIMAIGCEEMLPEIIERAGLLPRPGRS
jgi:methylenetetrahydrofolate reductase (NADPH)